MYRYQDLIHQTFDFPTEEFKYDNDQLYFNDVPLMDLVERHGTPLKITYLPKITSQIEKARLNFRSIMEEENYEAEYKYCYCTKSSHFSFVMEEVLKNKAHIETSSAYDIAIVRKLFEKGLIDKDRYVICNGFKRPLYTEYISQLLNNGYNNCIPILDNLKEIDIYEKNVSEPYQVGIRVAADEEPKFEFYTSRLGVRYTEIASLYKEKIAPSKKAKLKMLHFFINTGIKDTSYYWSELNRFVEKYCEMKKLCPELDTIDIGGGFPIKLSLYFDYDFKYMIRTIVQTIKKNCENHGVPVPHIITEFGNYTVGESGACLYNILDKKKQNDKELWYMIDSSFITNLPDSWALNQRFILLALNNWDKEFHKIKLGGLTCDSMDYYNSEMHTHEVFAPKFTSKTPQFIGFFHTGAYQESLGGFGGIHHCLIPTPKHVIINKDENGTLIEEVFREEQKEEEVLKILGY